MRARPVQGPGPDDPARSDTATHNTTPPRTSAADYPAPTASPTDRTTTRTPRSAVTPDSPPPGSAPGTATPHSTESPAPQRASPPHARSDDPDGRDRAARTYATYP